MTTNPGGRPVNMFFANEMYGVQGYLVPVPDNKIETLRSQCYTHILLAFFFNEFDVCLTMKFSSMQKKKATIGKVRPEFHELR